MTRRGTVRMWRWRRNPLRRRSDAVEAWVLLAVWVIALVGSLLAGLTTTYAVEHGLDRQRTQRHPVSAVLTHNAPGRTSAQAMDNDRVWATVRWTAPDGSAHTGRAVVPTGAKAGTRVTVWLDQRGRLTPKPLAPEEAAFQAAWTGALVGVGAMVVVIGGTQLVRTRLERRRLEQWDEEWARIDTRWGRKTG